MEGGLPDSSLLAHHNQAVRFQSILLSIQTSIKTNVFEADPLKKLSQLLT